MGDAALRRDGIHHQPDALVVVAMGDDQYHRPSMPVRHCAASLPKALSPPVPGTDTEDDRNQAHGGPNPASAPAGSTLRDGSADQTIRGSVRFPRPRDTPESSAAPARECWVLDEPAR